MPFAPSPKARLSATSRGCRAVVATRRLRAPGRELAVLRALALANFTTPLLLDDDAGLEQVLGGVRGVDAAAVIAALDDPEVTEAYEADRAEARRAAGSAAELQGKTADQRWSRSASPLLRWCWSATASSWWRAGFSRSRPMTSWSPTSIPS